MIIIVALIICVVCIEGLVPRTLSGTSDPQAGGGRINKNIDLGQEKVVTIINVKQNEKIVLCRFWCSSKFPYCDGKHIQHNSMTGDNVGPCIVTNENGQP